jgi:ATP-binding protein involved in chromosome partitioning
MIQDVKVEGQKVSFTVVLTTPACPLKELIHNACVNAIKHFVDKEAEVEIHMTANTSSARGKARPLLPGVKNIIAIASGKGGVGKSSLTANLAVAAAKKGLRVGILDADVYGHSIPRLMGLLGVRPTAIDQMFIPPESYGVKTVSMEMFKPERADAVAYRGPLLHRVLEQLLSDAYWGDLDLLLLDLPPGTGDLAISLGQLIPTSEILVVTTPQVAAAEVAERAGRIAHQMHQRVVGVIENMSAFICPTCNESTDLFGSGGGEETSARLSTLVGADVPLLGKVPFAPELRTGGDSGAPIVQAQPETPAAQAISNIVEKLIIREKSLLGVRLGVTS